MQSKREKAIAIAVREKLGKHDKEFLHKGKPFIFTANSPEAKRVIHKAKTIDEFNRLIVAEKLKSGNPRVSEFDTSQDIRNLIHGKRAFSFPKEQTNGQQFNDAVRKITKKISPKGYKVITNTTKGAREIQVVKRRN